MLRRAEVLMFALLVFTGVAHGALKVTTVVGRPETPAVENGDLSGARLAWPRHVAVDSAGNLYVAEESEVRRISTNGTVTTLAGMPWERGHVNGVGTAARFDGIAGIAVDAAGNVYVIESTVNAVRKISPSGEVTTFVGLMSEGGFVDDVGQSARLYSPSALAMGPDGVLYVGEWSFDVRKITAAGVVSTLAGSGKPKADSGTTDGIGANARFEAISALTVDANGIVYLADGPIIRRISPQGEVTTLAGSRFNYRLMDGVGDAAGFGWIDGLAALPNGDLLVSDAGGAVLRLLNLSRMVSTVAGQYNRTGYDDGIGGFARFHSPRGMATDASGNVYVADTGNSIIRKVTRVVADSPPIFTTGPYSLQSYAGAGGSVTLSVNVISDTPVTFTWFHGDTALTQTGSTCTLTNISAADAGSYSVRAANAGGAERLDLGTLTVYSPPNRSFQIRHFASGGSFLWGIAAGGGVTVAAGTGGTILTSSDGINWAHVNSGTSEWLLGVAYGVGRFVIVGDHGSILTSVDGQNWSRVSTTGTNQRLNNVIFGDALFVAVGEEGAIVTSVDGLTWMARESGTTKWLRGLAFNSALGQPTPWMGLTFRQPRYIAAGESGVAVQSDDGIIWQPAEGAKSDVEAMVAIESYGTYAGIGADGFAIPLSYFGGGTMGPPVLRWGLSSTGTPVRLRGIANGANVLFAFGEQGTVLAAPSGEGPWARVSSGTAANLVAGSFVGSSLFIVGENETVLESSPLWASRLVNISTRSLAGRDESTLISGFVIQGAAPKKVLIRAVGPELKRTFGLAEGISLPKLTLFDSHGQPIGTNAGWSSAENADELAKIASRVGAFPLPPGSADAALLVTLNPGVYTAHVTPAQGEAGIALMEVYDADGDTDANRSSRAVNISTRGEAGSGDKVLIAGFVVTGDSARRVLIRGIGPTLQSKFKIAGAVVQPTLRLFDSHGNLMRTAHDWSSEVDADAIADAARRTGAFALDEGSDDSAMLVTLLPGAYTAQVAGENGSSGIALVEVYDLP